MVPGVVAGHYAVMDAQIDLPRLADRAKVDLILDQGVEAGPSIVTSSGRERFDALFWAAGAALRSVSHPTVFAAGDTATLQGAALPKSGVFALRQGEVLAENLKRACRGESLRTIDPRQEASP